MKTVLPTLLSMIMIMVIMSMILLKKLVVIMIEWKIISIYYFNVKFLIMLDTKSSLFSLTVMIISTSIILYSSFYMNNTKNVMFIKVIMVFVASMIILIMSPNFTSLVLGWEGLGMSSFILIMFYMNKKSLMSSIYTMMMNRIGDMAMIISMMITLNWNSWLFMSSNFYQSQMLISMILISMFSKSAQIPFSAWLTEAMAAPTPVSALVHSSTLVTAGVYLMIRFESKLKYSSTNMLVFFISFITLLMASINSVLQWDIKKIIALSTLSQLSIMFITISTNMYNTAFFHMLTHAMFKALIFLCGSTFISMSNTQDLRKMDSLNLTSTMTYLSFYIANMSLCAFPFTSGFYSKETMLEMMMINKSNILTTLVLLLCMLSSFMYSLKMMSMATNNMIKTSQMLKETTQQKMSKMILLLPSVILGNKINWILNLNLGISLTSPHQKIIPIICLMVVIMLTTKMKKLMMKPNLKISMMMNYMWYTKVMMTYKKLKILNQFFLLFKTTEKSVITLSYMLIYMFMKNTSKLNFLLMQPKFKPSSLTMVIITLVIM